MILPEERIESMSDRPEISVIIPVYNVEPYVEQCVKSIAGQSFKKIEIILVDDGSPDSCPDICDRLAGSDPRIKVIHNPHLGLAAARNTGIDAAAGKYLMFADSDDFTAPGFLEIPLGAARKTGADIVIFQFAAADIDGRPVPSRRKKIQPAAIGRTRALCMLAEEKLQDYAWDKLYRRELFDTIRYPDGERWEDQATTYRLIDKASRLIILPDILYYYRMRPGSLIHEDLRTAFEIMADHRNQEYEYLMLHCPPAGRKMEITVARTELAFLYYNFFRRPKKYAEIRRRLTARKIRPFDGSRFLWLRIQLVRISPALMWSAMKIYNLIKRTDH